MDLSISETLVGRTLGRITPERQDDPSTNVCVSLVGKDNYLLMPADGVEINDVFINTMHRAVPITYVTYRPDAQDSHRWVLEIGGPRWVMVRIAYTPRNMARPLGCLKLKRVGR